MITFSSNETRVHEMLAAFFKRKIKFEFEKSAFLLKIALAAIGFQYPKNANFETLGGASVDVFSPYSNLLKMT